MEIKLFYFDTPEEYEAGCTKAIQMLKDVGFNEEVLAREIKNSKRDFGDEFFWMISSTESGKELLDEWKEKYDLSQKKYASDFVMRCTYDGD